MEATAPLILLAAGGTGGHLFPAEALGVELIKRGYRVRLVTDDRALRYSGLFTREMIDVVASETARGRNPLQLAYATLTLAMGTLGAFNLIRRENRFLSRHVRAIATSLPGVLDRDPALSSKTTTVGTPMRPAVLSAAATNCV